MADKACFAYLDATDLSEILDTINSLNEIKKKHSTQMKWWPSVYFVPVCNDAAEECGLIYWCESQNSYVFVPDMTGEGIDREKLVN